ncbi:MAG: septum formation initiator family protein [Prevotellaceae bacterium]|jgi:cell division protein FtsB|nr:septum formation initiator family protein [Prevotellaceae bacterium]
MNFSKITSRLPFFLRNKYIFTAAVFLLWLLFFDKTNLIDYISDKGKIRTLKAQKEHYEKGIQDITAQLEQLNTDNKSLEKFARERYYLKKEGEDIYLIEE